jgi:PUA domain protein
VPEESISSINQVKASVARGIRSSLLSQFPGLEDVISEILPKKTPLFIAKCQNHINLLIVQQMVVFFNERDGPYFPTLRLLHKYPNIAKKMQVDRGAIRFVLSGANVMCPGLTSPGGRMEDVPAETVVTIMAEGKQHALAVGITKLSTEEIRSVNKGIALDNIHYLNDGLWTYTPSTTGDRPKKE